MRTASSSSPTDRIKNWLPVVAWAGAIFLFSTDLFSSSHTSHAFGFLSWLFPSLPHEKIPSLHGVLRKLGHWAEYFILAVLLMRALQNNNGEKNNWRHAPQTAVLVFLYALTDEWHQSFVPSRTASFGDVMIDVLGGICGIFWLVWYQRGIRTPRISRLGYHKSLKRDDKIAKKT
ncbi:MAG: VanZ family protein [Candidatus Binatia bacterium]|jgi:VanZ family protein